MRIENKRMKDLLQTHGINAIPKRIFNGSLKKTWRLYNPDALWNIELANKLNNLGFANYNNKPLDGLDGNGGRFCVFVRGHEELL